MALALAVMSLFGSRVETSSNSAMTVVAICATIIVSFSVIDRMIILKRNFVMSIKQELL